MKLPDEKTITAFGKLSVLSVLTLLLLGAGWMLYQTLPVLAEIKQTSSDNGIQLASVAEAIGNQTELLEDEFEEIAERDDEIADKIVEAFDRNTDVFKLLYLKK